MSSVRNPLLDYMDEEPLSQDEINTKKAQERGKKGFEQNKDIIPPAPITAQSKNMNENPLLQFMDEESPEKFSLFSQKTPEEIQKGHEEIWETYKNIPRGIKEGLLEQYYAAKGEKYKPSPVPENQYPEAVETGREFGQLVGKTPAIAGSMAAGSRIAGLPGAMIGGAAAGFGLTPGNIKERLISGGITGAVPLAPKVIGGVIKGAKKLYGLAKAPFKKLEPLEEQVFRANENLLALTAEEKQAKELAQKKTGVTNLIPTLGKKQKELSELEIPTSSTLPIPSSKVSAQNLDNAIKSHENAKKLVSNIESEFDKTMGKGTAHPLHIASDVNRKINAIEAHYADRMNKWQESISDANFQMPKPVLEKYEVDQKKLWEAVNKKDTKSLKEGSFLNKPEISPTLKSIMDKAPTAADTNATDFITKMREFRDYRFELSQYMKKASPLERVEIKKALKDSKKMQATIQETLEEAVGVEKASELKEINLGYSDIIFPLKALSTAKKIRKSESQIPDYIKALTGESAYPRTLKGQKALRSIIESEPSIMRNVLGQKYAGKIEELHNPDELANHYLGKLIGTRNIIERHKQALGKISEHEKNVSRYKKEHETVTTQEKNAHNEVARQDKLIKEQSEKKSTLENEIKSLDENINKWKEIVKLKDIGLKEKIKLENELEKARSKRKKARYALGILVGYGAVKNHKAIENVIGLSKENGE
jgi:hypothetical protein